LSWPVDDQGRIKLKTLDGPGFERWAIEQGLPAYRGRQIFAWLYKKGASSFEEMTNLPAGLRNELSTLAVIETLDPVTEVRSSDGTIKSLLALSSGERIETVLIPDFDDDGSVNRMTVCVSSQVGCSLGCTFCATGKMGFRQDLSLGEIVDQVLLMDRLARSEYDAGISNIVFMGMGEPLMNYGNVLGSVGIITSQDSLGMSPKRITVSTVGLAKMIRKLADDETRFNLAISLHAPTDEKRSSIMPVNRSQRTDLKALREAVRYYYRKLKRPVTYEYCMLAGYNDSVEDAASLAGVCSWAPSKVNLIMYNSVDGTGFEATAEKELNTFIQALVGRGVRVTVRRSRGQDINAACGQLATTHTKSESDNLTSVP
jgi:23S rRNA (adenine2503-C2)-methyltransferase